MLIVMDRLASSDEITNVEDVVRQLGLTPHRIPGANRVAIGVTGNSAQVPDAPFKQLDGVIDLIRVTKPYKLVSREMKPEDTIIDVKGHRIGGSSFGIIAGPCSVETKEQLTAVAEQLSKLGVPFIRGGALKPRTSPYSFQGLGLEGFKMLRETADRYNLIVVSEVLDRETVELAAPYVDILQVGARNMQNFSLLKSLGSAGKPVLLKRGLSASLDDLLMSAEYLLSHGNSEVILCERGIRTFSRHQRNTFDVGVIPEIRKLSHLPIIADPSHASGKREMVSPLALAAIAAGANGLMIEMHPEPNKALSDGAQSLTPEEFGRLMERIRSCVEYFQQDPGAAGSDPSSAARRPETRSATQSPSPTQP